MRIIIIVFGFFLFHSVDAQEVGPSAVRSDTSRISSKSKILKIKEAFIPIPKKALIYSLILPGAGQVYNRKYWKVPLVLGAYGGLVYAFDFNGRQYNRFKKIYEYRIDGNPDTDPDELIPSGIATSVIKTIRDGARKNLELTYMAAIVVHALNGIEAFVDAHLRNFDVSEDLSLSIRPTFETNAAGIQSGVGLYFTF